MVQSAMGLTALPVRQVRSRETVEETGVPLFPIAGPKIGNLPHSGALRRTEEHPSDGAPQTRIVYRMPEHPPATPVPSAEREEDGEAILRAQTVRPGRSAAGNTLGDYPPVPANHRHSSSSPEPLTPEQEERITQRVLEDINYNRMASEVLDRVERRLRAERRKFGR